MSDSSSLQQLLQNYSVKNQDDPKYIAHEFQDFGYRMAMELTNPNDRETISMCMGLAKRKPRALLEQALSYIKDAKAKNKVALFLWKIKELEKEKQEKSAEKKKKEPQQTALPWE
ncbi:hypothetical protein LRY65_03465 [Candidatus Woesebacteria bacterium]|nr:hypothetical protein [Candidatus Woesebacteria bacterium]MCD8506953.1 hypothetical protein [Candidatus Woesebacteria bacterium]MCD8527243.1 hypothetical protein [Candidatus Woesebacteria bacterium]MCD8546610.1 hypothetical protein [Candidatus Woesebacteria bacterium]